MNRTEHGVLRRAWILAVALAQGLQGRAAGEQGVNRIVVEKSLQRTHLMVGETTVRRYDIAFGFAPAGGKQQGRRQDA